MRSSSKLPVKANDAAESNPDYFCRLERIFGGGEHFVELTVGASDFAIQFALDFESPASSIRTRRSM